MRVRFYIDGFNFYYSCFKHGRYGAYRWLDLSRFCRRIDAPPMGQVGQTFKKAPRAKPVAPDAPPLLRDVM